MKISFKQILTSNGVIFLCAVIIGYSLWLMLSQQQIIQQTVAIPAVVYDQQTVIHQSPINVRLEATRAQLKTLKYQPPHITFYREEHPEKVIMITLNDILVPETVKVVEYSPKSITVS